LVAKTGADLEDRIIGADVKQVRHQRHDIRRLVVTPRYASFDAQTVAMSLDGLRGTMTCQPPEISCPLTRRASNASGGGGLENGNRCDATRVASRIPARLYPVHRSRFDVAVAVRVRTSCRVGPSAYVRSRRGAIIPHITRTTIAPTIAPIKPAPSPA
jgi:hypothetical protein